MFNTFSRPRAAACTLAFTLACLLGGCSHDESAQEAAAAFVVHGQQLEVPADSPLRKRLKIAPVDMHQAPHELAFPANVEADPAHMANVLPALTGRVVSLDVNLGDHVQRGQLLAVIDSGDLAQAYADVDKARDALNLAKKALDRAHGVQQAGGAAVKDLEAAQSGYVQAEAEYRRAQTRLDALGGNADAKGASRPMQVRAPIDGTITVLSIAPGAFVNDATASMMTIANIDKLWITAEVPEDALGLVKQGQPATASVPAYPGRVFHGTVYSVGAVLDPASRRDPVRIAIDNADHALKPGMYATASLAAAQPAQVFVPESALLMNNDSTTVFVEVAPWTFERRAVELSYDENDGARVLKGLKAGDRVVVAGGVLLND
ncbi:efflux RND transporter periplasmic adaptor subunit [Rhodanobacter sp. 7MK24]|uniref:efflux RND transporter periplasmic adaptor subunit n=1 Tax=Rhodanobacter sp. 7MK24 TaxID=2775922 RepID=UPI001783CB2A|nr:efflux RND transporter periplasmic adaptor subunit [Rhodanobacter sp. 7MK24]MBD8882365.1 efflux RND transporter periplasmic adaptor subunit [Rhodanobacter sp. 7MK24]